ncbi:hypothetical protein BKA70DRAFT_1406899 [Coprinopsis sp. MPI-PUGE-AT-0042]|nr:hypothetical protein BKA70DRAFT_1406899 [Coprinopsis sp. MPI-PUGE-AT-0042]
MSSKVTSQKALPIDISTTASGQHPDDNELVRVLEACLIASTSCVGCEQLYNGGWMEHFASDCPSYPLVKTPDGQWKQYGSCVYLVTMIIPKFTMLMRFVIDSWVDWLNSEYLWVPKHRKTAAPNAQKLEKLLLSMSKDGKQSARLGIGIHDRQNETFTSQTEIVSPLAIEKRYTVESSKGCGNMEYHEEEHKIVMIYVRTINLRSASICICTAERQKPICQSKKGLLQFDLLPAFEQTPRNER